MILKSLLELVQTFMNQERPVGILLHEDIVLAQAIAATRFYAGYAILYSRSVTDPDDPVLEIDGNLHITESEWALIRQLFWLYVERENALHLEASRGLGIDPYGRSSSEIAQDITVMEGDLPQKAFFHPIISV